VVPVNRLCRTQHETASLHPKALCGWARRVLRHRRVRVVDQSFIK
jgi:hypothetical protein